MHENDERLLQAIRAGNIGIFDHDHEAETLYWSLELRQMYGWEADEPATLQKILSQTHPEDAGRVVAEVRRAHDPEGDGLFDIEHRIITRAGEVRWLLTRSRTHFEQLRGERRPRRTIGAVQDVTDRRAAEERLRVLDTVLSSSVQAIAIADAQGKLTFANTALRRLWAYSDQEPLLGRSIFELWKTLDEPSVALSRLRAHRTERVEIPAVRVDGSTFYLHLTAEAVCDAKGALTQVLVTFSDVTDRKRLENQLLHSQKMESIGRLAGGVAHDFNNILTVISCGLELSMSSLPVGHRSRDYLSDAADAARSAAALTRQLLAFSRKETIAPRKVDLNEVIRRVEKMIVRLLGEDIRCQTICGQDLTPICFDPGQVEQIILNLVVNARDAMISGGQLTIETSNVDIDEEYAARHIDARPGPHALLAVSDNGIGMSDEVRAHLFEPFFTSKEAGKGTGLGLAVVYGVVQQNGGWIEFESGIDQGTTFKIYLPAASGASSAPPLQIVRPAEACTVSIVLVEDDPKVRALTETMLKSLGHSVRAFPTGEEALQWLPGGESPPDLLITDVIMPGINGRTLAERATAILPKMLVLFVSGYTHNVIAKQGVLSDGVEFLAKPYSAEQLGRRVREVIAKGANASAAAGC